MLLSTSEECLHMRINHYFCISIIISRKGRRLLVKTKIPRAVSTSHRRDLNMARRKWVLTSPGCNSADVLQLKSCCHGNRVCAIACSMLLSSRTSFCEPQQSLGCCSQDLLPISLLRTRFRAFWRHSVCEIPPHTTAVWPELGIRTVGYV